MNNWTNCKIGDFLTFHYGKSLSAEKRVEGNIPVYSSAGLTGWHNEALVESEGLIIGRKGTIGKVYKSKQPFFVIDTAYYIKPDQEKYDLDYVYYLLSSIGLDELNEDSAVPGLNRNTAYAQEVFLPPLKEQKAIAEVLSSLDDKIDLLHRQNQTLEKLAESHFRHLFIDNAQDDWEEKPLSFFGEIVCGKTPSKTNKDYFGGSVPFIKIPDMHGQVFVFKTSDTLTFEGKESQKNKTIPSKSICVSCIATVGLVSMNAIEAQTNQQINSIIPKAEFYRYFLFLFLKSSEDLLKALASGGTTTLNLNTSNFSDIRISKPNDSFIKSFNDSVSGLFDKIFANQEQIQNLEKTRDQLLPKLISGEVKV